jgi:hypothetical protein
MKFTYKSLSIFLGLGIIFILLIVASQTPSPAQIISTPNFVSTPVQDKYTQAFLSYLTQLNQEGLQSEKEIKVEDSKPFIFIFRPQKSQEITETDTQNITDVALRAVSIFESRGGIRHNDIDMAFHRPTNQNIILINRRNMPELLSENIYGEMTLSIDSGHFHSIVNLAGPHKNGRKDYANSWSVIQAICIAYAGNFQDVDPVCNIISANAAAGWVGIEPDEAEEIINGYGATQLSYLGNKDYQYRFIDFVYNDFIR